MTATVVSLDAFRARRTDPVATNIRERLKDRLAQLIMQEFHDWPVLSIKRAIEACGKAIDSDFSFPEAMEAAERCLMGEAAMRNDPRIQFLLARRRRRQEGFFDLAVRTLRDKLPNATPLEFHYACVTARGVIENGGCLGSAIQLAMAARP